MSEIYQCLNNHVADSHNGNCQVDGCPYGPNPRPASEPKYRPSESEKKNK